MKPKIGLVTVSLPREMPELAKDFHKRAINVLTKNAEVIASKDGKVALTREEAVREAKIAEKKGAECLLFIAGSWIFAPQIVCAAQAVHKPVGLWTSPCMPSAAMVGGSITHGSLDEVGIDHAYF